MLDIFCIAFQRLVWSGSLAGPEEWALGVILVLRGCLATTGLETQLEQAAMFAPTRYLSDLSASLSYMIAMIIFITHFEVLLRTDMLF